MDKGKGMDGGKRTSAVPSNVPDAMGEHASVCACLGAPTQQAPRHACHCACCMRWGQDQGIPCSHMVDNIFAVVHTCMHQTTSMQVRHATRHLCKDGQQGCQVDVLRPIGMVEPRQHGWQLPSCCTHLRHASAAQQARQLHPCPPPTHTHAACRPTFRTYINIRNKRTCCQP